MEQHALLHQARRLLHAAQRPLVLTGAGFSVVPDPDGRGPGTWQAAESPWRRMRDPAWGSTAALTTDPTRFWRWILTLRRQAEFAATTDLRAHRALAGWLAQSPTRRLVTQNVDGLHRRAWERAGSPPGSPIFELHGSLDRLRCCSCQQVWALPEGGIDPADPPRCQVCDGLLGPEVVWMGDAIPPWRLDQAWSWARGADACVVIGTSGQVEPAGLLPRMMQAREVPVVVVDIDPQALSSVAQYQLVGSAWDLVPRLFAMD